MLMDDVVYTRMRLVACGWRVKRDVINITLINSNNYSNIKKRCNPTEDKAIPYRASFIRSRDSRRNSTPMVGTNRKPSPSSSMSF